MERTSFSSKHTDIPSFVAMIILQPPSVCKTVISSSPSSSESALMPLERMFLNRLCAVRLTVPLRVTNMRKLSSSMPLPAIMALTFSPGSMGMMLTMLLPRAVLPASGMR